MSADALRLGGWEGALFEVEMEELEDDEEEEERRGLGELVGEGRAEGTVCTELRAYEGEGGVVLEVGVVGTVAGGKVSLALEWATIIRVNNLQSNVFM